MDVPHTPPKADEPAAEPAPAPPVEPANGPSADEFVAPVNVEVPQTSRAEREATAVASAAPAVATRYCAMCDDRVPVAADGLHCHLGHALSGAHRKPKRRWFGLRR